MECKEKNKSIKMHVKIIFFIAIFLIGFITLINIGIQTKKYVKVNAIINNSYLDYNNPKFPGIYKTIEFTYIYNGQEYTSTDATLFFNNEPGTIINVYINPDNPLEVRSNFETRLLTVSSIILFIIDLIFIKIHIDIRNNKKRSLS